MNSSDFGRVEAWLYSIPRLQIAIENLNLELDKLDTRAASPPRWMSNPDAVPSTGCDVDSRQAKWMEFMDEYELRRQEIERKLEDRRRQIRCFDRVMDMLREESALYSQLVRKKYLEKIKPDKKIWEHHLYVGKTKFYEMRIYVVEAFFECLPGQFPEKERTKRELKSV